MGQTRDDAFAKIKTAKLSMRLWFGEAQFLGDYKNDSLLQLSQPLSLLVSGSERGNNVDGGPTHHEGLVRCPGRLCYVIDAGRCPHVTHMDTLLQSKHIARPETQGHVVMLQ